MPRIRFYVDGLNFYYGIAQEYNFKWIDLEGLLRALVRQREPQAEVERILLFTAKVLGDDKRARQAQYLNALQKHSPQITVCWGQFQNHEKLGKLLEGPNADEPLKVQIPVEKRTDVNLACHMVEDAYKAAICDTGFDLVCLVSNDSDFTAALEVKKRLNQRTILLSPIADHVLAKPSKQLASLVGTTDMIPNVPEDIVRSHPLPKQVGEYKPPEADGWFS